MSRFQIKNEVSKFKVLNSNIPEFQRFQRFQSVSISKTQSSKFPKIEMSKHQIPNLQESWNTHMSKQWDSHICKNNIVRNELVFSCIVWSTSAKTKGANVMTFGKIARITRKSPNPQNVFPRFWPRNKDLGNFARRVDIIFGSWSFQIVQCLSIVCLIFC